MIILPKSSPFNAPSWALVFAHPLHCLSLGFGTGLSPKAPGTVGTLVGYPVFLLLSPLPVLWQSVCLLALFVLGIICCQHTGKALGVSDHGAIVWDEIVAMAWVLTTVPMTLGWAVLAFVLFRLFDIAKPFPINWLDAHVKGGLGVMLDDVLAGLMAIICLQCLLRLLA